MPTFVESFHMEADNQASIPEKIVATTNTIGEKPNEEIREKLILLVNELITTDFDALVQLLYRIDVDELKLKQLLKDRPDTDAASIIADLIIIRQLQKIATRKEYNDTEGQDTNESW